jgi:hypothetical protein
VNFDSVSNERKRAIHESALAAAEDAFLLEMVSSGLREEDFADTDAVCEFVQTSENPDIQSKYPRFAELNRRIAFCKEKIASL